MVQTFGITVQGCIKQDLPLDLINDLLGEWRFFRTKAVSDKLLFWNRIFTLHLSVSSPLLSAKGDNCESFVTYAVQSADQAM